jgi:hypothetical protein
MHAAPAGEPLGPFYDELNTRIAWLTFQWRSYRSLFATSKARVNLINDSAPGMGRLIHDLLVEAVILGICRVADPASTGKNKNLTLEGLVRLLSPAPVETRSKWLSDQCAKIKHVATALKEHRDKRIAHTDLDVALGPGNELPAIPRRQIDEVLALIHEFMGNILFWHTGAGLDFNMVVPGDAESLVHCMQRSDILCELQDDYHCRRLGHEQIVAKLANRGLPQI